MNKIEEIANMFGVELYEPFNIVGNNHNPYKFALEGLVSSTGNVCPFTQNELLIGRLQMEKLPFKPKYDDRYYWVGCVGKINRSTWHDNTQDYCLFNVGNCFRTLEEISVDDIDRIVKEMKGKYEGV